jgi:hypothetical protein
VVVPVPVLAPAPVPVDPRQHAAVDQHVHRADAVSASEDELEPFLHSLGVHARVYPVLRKEEVTDMDTLSSLDKSELRSIGIKLGDAQRIWKALHASD